jgi:hypothetical protein
MPPKMRASSTSLTTSSKLSKECVVAVTVLFDRVQESSSVVLIERVEESDTH